MYIFGVFFPLVCAYGSKKMTSAWKNKTKQIASNVLP